MRARRARQSFLAGAALFAATVTTVMFNPTSAAASTPISEPVLAATIGNSFAPGALAFDDATNVLYVADATHDSVWVVTGGTYGNSYAISGSVPVDGAPSALAVDSATDTVYVALGSSDTVEAIDGSTDTVVATIPVGGDADGIAVDPQTSTVYVAEEYLDSVAVISTVTDAVVGRIGVGVDPNAVAVDPALDEVFVSNGGSGSLSVIDPADDAVTTVQVGDDPDAVVVDPVDEEVFVANYTSDSLSVVTEDGDYLTATISLPIYQNPTDLAYYASHDTIEVAYEYGRVSDLDAATQDITATEPYGSTTVAVNATSGDVLTADAADGQLYVMSGDYLEQDLTGAVDQSTQVAVDSETGTVFVPNATAGTVSTFQGISTVPTATFPAGSDPGAIAVDPATGMFYVADYSQNRVLAMSEASDDVLASIATGDAPDAIAVNTATDTIYVANYSGNSVSVIDGTTNEVTATIGLGSGSDPNAITVNQAGNQVLVANGGGTISVISGYIDALVDTLTGFYGLDGIAYDPNTGEIYALGDYYSGPLYVLNSGLATVATVYAPEYFTDSLALDPTSDTVYVGGWDGFPSTLSTFDPATNTFIGGANGSCDDYASQIAVDAANDNVYVACDGELQDYTTVSTPSVATTSLPDAVAGSPYAFPLTASNGVGPYTWAITSGTLPSGLELNGNTGVISGEPLATGTTDVTFQVTDSQNYGASQELALTVSNAGVPAISSADTTTFIKGDPSSFAVDTTGFSGTPVLTKTGALPLGLKFVDNHNGTATLSGTPTVGVVAKAYDLTITATGTGGQTATQVLVLNVDATPSFTTADSATAGVDESFSFKVTASGSPHPAISATSLPSWLTITPAVAGGSAVVSGVPPAGTQGKYEFTLAATNAAGTATATFAISVLGITSANTTTFESGTSDSFLVKTSPAVLNASITETGALPTGVSLVANGDGSALLEGTPTGVDKNYAITIAATVGKVKTTQRFTLVVN